MTQQFQRRIEDFTCDHCGEPVEGDGYTNHCPACLWSKHVDVHPGDRASDCRELMRPATVLFEQWEYIIVHRCVECGHEKRNKAAPDDDRDTLIMLSAMPS